MNINSISPWYQIRFPLDIHHSAGEFSYLVHPYFVFGELLTMNLRLTRFLQLYCAIDTGYCESATDLSSSYEIPLSLMGIIHFVAIRYIKKRGIVNKTSAVYE